MRWAKAGKLGASVSRKLSDQEFGSFEFAAWFEGETGATDNLDEELAALEAWLSAQVAQRMKAFQERVTPAKANEQLELAQEADARPEPVNVPIDDAGNEYATFVVTRIVIGSTQSGAIVGKAFGGRYAKWGVTVWPERIEELFPGRELTIGDELPVKAGTTARVLLNDKGNPSKVVAWE